MPCFLYVYWCVLVLAASVCKSFHSWAIATQWDPDSVQLPVHSTSWIDLKELLWDLSSKWEDVALLFQAYILSSCFICFPHTSPLGVSYHIFFVESTPRSLITSGWWNLLSPLLNWRYWLRFCAAHLYSTTQGQIGQVPLQVVINLIVELQRHKAYKLPFNSYEHELQNTRSEMDD